MKDHLKTRSIKRDLEDGIIESLRITQQPADWARKSAVKRIIRASVVSGVAVPLDSRTGQ